MTNVVTPGQLYWLTRCDSLCGLFEGTLTAGAVLLAALVVFLVCTAINLAEEPDNLTILEGARKLRKGAVAALALVVACATCRALTPTTREMAAILVMPRIANSQTVGDLAGGVVALAREWMQELRPKNATPSVPAEKEAE